MLERSRRSSRPRAQPLLPVGLLSKRCPKLYATAPFPLRMAANTTSCSASSHGTLTCPLVCVDMLRPYEVVSRAKTQERLRGPFPFILLRALARCSARRSEA